MTSSNNQYQGPDQFPHKSKSKRLRRASALIPVLLMAVATIGVAWTMNRVVPASSATAESEFCVADDASLIVPEKGVLFGVNLDWDNESIAQYKTNLGHAPAMAVQFTDIPYDRETWQHTLDAVDQVKQNGGALLLTLEPHAGLSAVSTEVIAQLAEDLRELNDDGVPVVLRYAHEMNGSWYAWGQQPAEYIASFRRVADAVHAKAPGSSMMWAPNYGGGYPFVGGKFAASSESDNFKLLDTNNDGALTMADDSYAPYYPGDDVVDWAGVSLYHWGNQRPWGSNDPLVENHKFADMLTGEYSGTAGDDIQVPDFYHVYGDLHNKPIAIPETAAIYTPSRGGTDELDIKQAWWRQVFADSFASTFPKVKMINWFEWQKYEIEIDDTVDWRAAGSPHVRDAFVADLPTWLHYAQDVRACKAG
ncbi:glycoside hydrolase family 26 protein [Bifidobacterium tibiigranuli]|jgi:hypothetical protein|uniref:glycoside hydrolase family 26 protein n=1 Tax=Bifidobacterium tibiigranuli TaxID=2172043 RepID=UPI0026EA36C2|nr:glycosyl hydrolase [Bifidobacterium tibiigranuli]MCI1649483.1 hypothetical protein [Bifidobacterium tibiigranuli]MCI2186155.1 hypothetical protein [Bifidobacterium tibiigranuli]MCI2204018.1 hypothetical protein [Bifidobacterium tibiigranuli]